MFFNFKKWLSDLIEQRGPEIHIGVGKWKYTPSQQFSSFSERRARLWASWMNEKDLEQSLLATYVLLLNPDYHTESGFFGGQRPSGRGIADVVACSLANGGISHPGIAAYIEDAKILESIHPICIHGAPSRREYALRMLEFIIADVMVLPSVNSIDAVARVRELSVIQQKLQAWRTILTGDNKLTRTRDAERGMVVHGVLPTAAALLTQISRRVIRLLQANEGRGCFNYLTSDRNTITLLLPASELNHMHDRCAEFKEHATVLIARLTHEVASVAAAVGLVSPPPTERTALFKKAKTNVYYGMTNPVVEAAIVASSTLARSNATKDRLSRLKEVVLHYQMMIANIEQYISSVTLLQRLQVEEEKKADSVDPMEMIGFKQREFLRILDEVQKTIEEVADLSYLLLTMSDEFWQASAEDGMSETPHNQVAQIAQKLKLTYTFLLDLILIETHSIADATDQYFFTTEIVDRWQPILRSFHETEAAASGSRARGIEVLRAFREKEKENKANVSAIDAYLGCLETLGDFLHKRDRFSELIRFEETLKESLPPPQVPFSFGRSEATTQPVKKDHSFTDSDLDSDGEELDASLGDETTPMIGSGGGGGGGGATAVRHSTAESRTSSFGSLFGAQPLTKKTNGREVTSSTSHLKIAAPRGATKAQTTAGGKVAPVRRPVEETPQSVATPRSMPYGERESIYQELARKRKETNEQYHVLVAARAELARRIEQLKASCIVEDDEGEQKLPETVSNSYSNITLEPVSYEISNDRGKLESSILAFIFAVSTAHNLPISFSSLNIASFRDGYNRQRALLMEWKPRISCALADALPDLRNSALSSEDYSIMKKVCSDFMIESKQASKVTITALKEAALAVRKKAADAEARRIGAEADEEIKAIKAELQRKDTSLKGGKLTQAVEEELSRRARVKRMHGGVVTELFAVKVGRAAAAGGGAAARVEAGGGGGGGGGGGSAVASDITEDTPNLYAQAQDRGFVALAADAMKRRMRK